jgi:hypothetical protein
LDWTYDKTGNRLAETRNGTTSTYTYEPGTSRLATVTGGTPHVLAYDDSGNATRYDDLRLDDDAADRLVAIRRIEDPVGCGVDRTGACSTVRGGVWRLLCSAPGNFWQSAFCGVGAFVVGRPAQLMCKHQARLAEGECRCGGRT